MIKSDNLNILSIDSEEWFQVNSINGIIYPIFINGSQKYFSRHPQKCGYIIHEKSN